MATPFPNYDPFDPLNQLHMNCLIQAAFGNEGLDAFEADAGQIYSAEWKRPLVCSLLEEALSAGWLGRTQWEISEKLTKMKDRAWVSRARYRGRISLELFLRLWFHPDRPKGPAAISERLRAEMSRSAAIGIARAIAKLAPASLGLVPEFLTELNYELGCAVVDPAPPWDRVRRSASGDGAIAIVRQACGEKAVNAAPSWYTDLQRRQAVSEIIRLTSSGEAALQRLELLSDQWRGVLCATAQLMESIRMREAKDAA